MHRQFSRPRHTSATRDEQIAHYLEVAIIVATDRAASLQSRHIDAPRLVTLAFLDNFPEDTTVEEIRTALLSPYQSAPVPAITYVAGEVPRG